jgi:uncharacterized RDD family membrane protein YckC
MSNEDRNDIINIDLEDLDSEPRQVNNGHSNRIEIDLDAEDLNAGPPLTQYSRPSYDRAQIGQTAHYQEPIRQQHDTGRGNDWSNSSRAKASTRSARSGPRVNRDGFYEYEKAANGSRFIAFLVDCIIAFLPVAAGYLVFFISLRSLLYTGNSFGYIIGVVLMLIGILWSWCYLLIRDGLGKGQSIGKKLFGLMTIRLEDNQPCTKANSMMRNLIAISLSVIDLLYGAVHNKGQRIGDVQLKTQVIHVKDYQAG